MDHEANLLKRSFGRRDFLKYGALGAASLSGANLLAACGASSPTATVKKADEVIYGEAGTETSINPLQTLGHSESYACWDALTYVDPTRDGAVFPRLATSWSQLDDVTMEFKLRSGVKFSDGSPMTATDVKYSYDTTISQQLAVFSEVSGIASVDIVDPLTVRITTKVPDPLLERRASLLFIVPQSVYSSVGTKAFEQHAVGTGKYRVVDYTPGQVIHMEANKYSWAGQPVTPKFTWQMFSNSSACMDALLAGQIDFTDFTGGSGIVEQLTAFNTLSAQVGGPRNLRLDTTKPPFDNPMVRLAMNYAIDIETLCQTVNKGFGVPLAGQMPTAQCFGYDASIKAFGYDQAKAKSLLAQAGYANGFTTQIASALTYHDLMVGIAGYLQQVGVTATVVDQSFPTFIGDFFNGTTVPMWMYGANFSPLYDADLTFQWMTAPIPPAKGTRSWIDPNWDQMLTQERQEINTATRLAELQAMSVYLHEQVPIVFLDSQSYLYAWSKKVFDFHPQTGFFFLADTMYKTA